MSGVAVAIGAGALIGGAAGGMEDKTRQSSSGSSGVNLAPESELEKQGTRITGDSLSALEGMVKAGPGQADVTAGYGASKGLASLLDDYARTGGVTQGDRLQAGEDAKIMFGGQREALNQSFQQSQQDAARLAAQLGRPINDPIIQAKLGQSRMQAEQMLAANQGAWQWGQANQLSQNRLGFTGQAADIRSQLASQAMQNRQALLSLGQGVQGAERSWRYNISDKWNNQTQEQVSGGGLKGALSGMLMGAGAGMGMAGGMQSMNMNQKFMDSGMTPAQYYGGGQMQGPQLPPQGSVVSVPYAPQYVTNSYPSQGGGASRFMSNFNMGSWSQK